MRTHAQQGTSHRSTRVFRRQPQRSTHARVRRSQRPSPTPNPRCWTPSTKSSTSTPQTPSPTGSLTTAEPAHATTTDETTRTCTGSLRSPPGPSSRWSLKLESLRTRRGDSPVTDRLSERFDEGDRSPRGIPNDAAGCARLRRAFLEPWVVAPRLIQDLVTVGLPGRWVDACVVVERVRE